MKRWLVIFVLSLLHAQITERYHPELKWQRFETTHFNIVFHEGTKRSAVRIANIAESIYKPVTDAYDFKPKDRISFIVKDVDDYSNGGAYFLDDKIEIWTENLDYDLRGTHEWLKDVVTHEFTHMVHIQKSLASSKNIPFAILQWIGYEDERRKDVVRGFPNRIANLPILFFNIPPWLAEGVAQHQNDASRFDYRDSQREMILRDRFMNNQVLSLEEMNSFGKTSIGNESVYNQGYSFVQFLIGKFGQKALIDISTKNASFKSLIMFDRQVFKENFNQSLDSLYKEWYQEKKSEYKRALDEIREKPTKATYLEREGEGNFYPKFSDDGNYLAYLSNGENRALSQNELIIRNQKTSKKEAHTALVSSQITWLPKSHKLIYSKQTEANAWGSHYNDLYLYDLESETEQRITYNCRARNATITDDGTLVFVTSYDGSTNLMAFQLGDEKSEHTIDYENLQIINGQKKSEDHFFLRKGWIMGKNLRFISHNQKFVQYFHPVVKDNQHIFVDKSESYKRFISEVDLKTGKEKIVLKGDSDFRNPFWDGKNLYYASDQSGIFNIYRKRQEKSVALSNVLGGAFMPYFDGKKLVYSEYHKLGFKIAELDSVEELEGMSYSIREQFPLKNRKIKANYDLSVKTSRQKYKFNSYYLIPRIMMDDKRPKFGFAFLANELLNKSLVYFTAVYNSLGERDIYAGIEVRNFSLFGRDPVFFFDFYNQSVSIDDRLQIRFDENDQFIEANRDVKFILWQYELGWKLKLWDAIDWKMTYAISEYNAELSPTVSDKIYDNGSSKNVEFPFFRYSYHQGKSIDNKFLFETHDKSFTGEIAPKNSQRFLFSIANNNYDFLDRFAFNTTGLEEVFTNYKYWSWAFSGHFSFANFWNSSSWLLDWKTAGNLSDVDAFYDHYAGGWIGLKGYPYFSLHGKKMTIFSLYFNQLLAEDIKLNIGMMRLKNLAFTPYLQAGDAWNKSEFSLKSAGGFQLKADSYGPLKIFFDAAFPFERVYGKERNPKGEFDAVVYPKEWRYYFGLLYDFDLKEIL